MILANVAAAEMLEKKALPLIYRWCTMSQPLEKGS